MLRVETINGVKLHVESQGTGPAILTLHGAPGLGSRHDDVAVWKPIAEDGYQVISYDQRGSGASDLAPPFSHEQLVADAEALRKNLGLGKIVLSGHSYGGFLAQEYALRHPENLAGLILGDTAASSAFQDRSMQRALGSGLPGITPEGLKRLFGGDTHSDEEFRQMYKAILPLYTESPPPPEAIDKEIAAIPFHYQTHNWAFSRNQPAFDLRAQLKKIRVPTLVMVGRKDWITPVEAAEEIARGIAGSRLVIFERSGHGPQHEENEKYLATVREFLSRVHPRRP
jgi:proline-specific peptidase